jgi:hypothetical protein
MPYAEAPLEEQDSPQIRPAVQHFEVTEDEAKLLVGILLSAAADTTVMTLANAIRAFSASARASSCWSPR